MRFNMPLGDEKASQLIRLLLLDKSDTVLDVGCGDGAFLGLLHAEMGCSGLGVDIDQRLIAAANEQHAIQQLEFKTANAREVVFEADSFDAGLCLGSVGAFGDGADAFEKALVKLSGWIRPKKPILIADTYWKQTPHADYLALLGEPTGVYRTHAENIMLGEQLGLTPVVSLISNLDEWDAFELAHFNKIKENALANPNYETYQQRLAWGREWYEMYQYHGRATMGFGFYLFKND